MDRKVFLLFCIFLSHMPSLLSSEDPEQDSCGSRCWSILSKCCPCLAPFCEEQEAEQSPEQSPQEEEQSDSEITRTTSMGKYKYVDPNADDALEADTAGYVEIEATAMVHVEIESPTHSPRTSTTGTLRYAKNPEHGSLPSFGQSSPPSGAQEDSSGEEYESSSDSEPDLSGLVEDDET